VDTFFLLEARSDLRFLVATLEYVDVYTFLLQIFVLKKPKYQRLEVRNRLLTDCLAEQYKVLAIILVRWI
jgi:hypothetical protein